MPRPVPTLAATLIARNEARCIRRCLDSLRPWVDRIVMLDTGSSDDTAAIAASAGAEVYHVPWPDSFAEARNHLLDLAKADWHLMIDADEWIASGGDQLRPWCAGPPRLGRVCVLSEVDGADASTTRSWITRLLPRGVRYEGRVHEQVVSDLPRLPIELRLGHDGYRDAQIDRKRDRNGPLLRRDLADRPGDPYILYQLGKDAEMRDDVAAACGWFSQSLAFTAPDANWRHELVLRSIQAMSRAQHLDDALALADAEFNKWPTSPDFFFILGQLLLDHAISDPAHALNHWLPLATGAWERCLAIGERPNLEGSVAGRGSHLAAHNLEVVRSQLALLGA